jgi:hypothetical protein
MKRANYPNLLRAPHAPAAGRGRLQRQINRCFVVFGPEVTSSRLYDWCYAPQSQSPAIAGTPLVCVADTADSCRSDWARRDYRAASSVAAQGMTHQRAPLWLSGASWRDRIPIPGRGKARGMTRGHPRHSIDAVRLLDAPMILSTVQSIPGREGYTQDVYRNRIGRRADLLHAPPPAHRQGRQAGPGRTGAPGAGIPAAGRPAAKTDPRGYFSVETRPGDPQEPSPRVYTPLSHFFW